jgi:hypothetical protein
MRQQVVRPFHRPIGLRRGGAEAIGVPYPEPSDGRFDVVYPWDVSGHGELSLGGQPAGIVVVNRLGEGGLHSPLSMARRHLWNCANTP